MFRQWITREWTTREKRMLVMIVGLTFVLISISFSSWLQKKENEDNSFELLSTPPLVTAEEDDHSQTKSPEEQMKVAHHPEERQTLVIDVKGAVQSPAVYEMVEGERVHDAIAKAGGLLEHGTTRTINLALKVSDGMVLYIPTEEEAEAEELFSFNQPLEGSPSATGKVNINKATAAELERLPGIGPSRAQSIITYREEQGSFVNIEELMNVSGIGSKIFEGLKDEIET